MANNLCLVFGCIYIKATLLRRRVSSIRDQGHAVWTRHQEWHRLLHCSPRSFLSSRMHQQLAVRQIDRPRSPSRWQGPAPFRGAATRPAMRGHK